MKKLLFFSIVIVLMGAGCSNNKIKDSVPLVNTFRDPKILLQINYPQNWVITDYVDYDRNEGCILYKEKDFLSEKYGEDVFEDCSEGVKFTISNYPTPYPGWSINYSPPSDHMGILVSVKLNENMYKDYYENENNVVKKEKEEIDIGSGNKLQIIIYDYKSQTGIRENALPTAIAHYYGNNYLYEFSMPRWRPNTEQEINIFKQIVKTFKEIK